MFHLVNNNRVIWDKFENNNNKSFKIKSIVKKLNIEPLKKILLIF